MNGRSQHQFLTERCRCNVLEGGRNGRCRHHVEAEAAMQTFSFGRFRIVPYARLLERDGSPIPLGSRAFDLLCILVTRPGQVVSKGELIARTWPDAKVEETSLRFHIAQLRRALGDSQGSERYVVNVPGRGYCFVACVSREALPLKRSHGKSKTDSGLLVPAVRRLATM
jgi:DNA-binding winged helix-turn-helix (wHTH) protein